MQEKLYLFLVVRYDTSDEMRIGVGESTHQLYQLLFIQLSHCTEHSFLCH